MDYVREYRLGDFVRSAFAIYFGNFRVLLGIYLIPSLPFGWLQVYSSLVEDYLVSNVALVLLMLVTFFIQVALTVAVSDLCLGHRPEIRRSFGRIIHVKGPLIRTYVLLIPIISIGLILIIPGLVSTIYLMFSLPVVALERTGGINALKRSYRLVKNQFWRNLSVLIVIGLIYGVILLAIIVLVTILTDLSAENLSPVILSLVGFIFASIPGPLLIIPTVLLYYDCRVRKEHFDLRGLDQEFTL